VAGASIMGMGALAGVSSLAGEDTLILRADGQVAGGPRVPGWEGSSVVWASEQRAAGGSWREYTDAKGKQRVEVALLLPPATTAARAQVVAERPALFYDGLVFEMRDHDAGGQKEKKREAAAADTSLAQLRVIGSVFSGSFGPLYLLWGQYLSL
jgi:hypothetical protein